MKKTVGFGRWLAWLLVMSISATGWTLDKPKEVLLLPFGLAEKVQPPEKFNLAGEISNALYARLAKLEGLLVQRFKSSHPSVQRAVEEGRLKKERLVPPFNVQEADGTWLAVKVGREMAATYVVAGTIEEYRYEESTKQVTLTLSVDLLQVKENKVLLSSAETARVRGKRDSEENTLVIEAISSVVQKLTTAMEATLKGVQAPAPQEAESKQKSSRQEGGFFALLGFSLLIWLRSMMR